MMHPPSHFFLSAHGISQKEGMNKSSATQWLNCFRNNSSLHVLYSHHHNTFHVPELTICDRYGGVVIYTVIAHARCAIKGLPVFFWQVNLLKCILFSNIMFKFQSIFLKGLKKMIHSFHVFYDFVFLSWNVENSFLEKIWKSNLWKEKSKNRYTTHISHLLIIQESLYVPEQRHQLNLKCM